MMEDFDAEHLAEVAERAAKQKAGEMIALLPDRLKEAALTGSRSMILEYDYAEIQEFLESKGFSVEHVGRGHMRVSW